MELLLMIIYVFPVDNYAIENLLKSYFLKPMLECSKLAAGKEIELARLSGGTVCAI
jgi:hypothetical protein